MQKRVARVFKSLARKGMTRAYLKIGSREFIYPSILAPRKRTNKSYIVLLGIAVSVAAGAMIWNHGFTRDVDEPIFSGTSIRYRDQYGLGRLHRAVINGKQNRIKQLLDWGFEVNSQDQYGWTPLHWAVFKGDANICRRLLDRGAQVVVKTGKKWFKYPAGLTCTGLAELMGNREIADILQRMGGENEKK